MQYAGVVQPCGVGGELRCGICGPFRVEQAAHVGQQTLHRDEIALDGRAPRAPFVAGHLRGRVEAATAQFGRVVEGLARLRRAQPVAHALQGREPREPLDHDAQRHGAPFGQREGLERVAAAVDDLALALEVLGQGLQPGAQGAVGGVVGVDGYAAFHADSAVVGVQRCADFRKRPRFCGLMTQKNDSNTVDDIRAVFCE